MNKIKLLLDNIFKKDDFQKKYFDKYIQTFSADEIKSFSSIIEYYLIHGETIDSIANAYLFWINDIREEQYYFIKNKRYRYSTAKEIENYFYKNPNYMKKYMLGLAISTYLLDSHRKCFNFYIDNVCSIQNSGGGKWLEIGPGHGEYLLEAAKKTDFELYYGIDISQTCVEMCRNLMKSRKSEFGEKKIVIEKKDFFTLKNLLFDAVVIGEVLEHVENPRLFLKKIHSITKDESFIYVATVVNCPQKDHIYQFDTIESIETMYREEGFEIKKSIFVPTNGYSIEKAVKRNVAINTAHILQRRKI